MNEFIFARTIHVLAIIFWIGGVAFVTLVVMPMLKAHEAPAARLARFKQIESGFAWQARLWVLLAGTSGFWMVWRADLWNRFVEPGYWWMHAMVAVWVIFALILFLIEALHLNRRMVRSLSPELSFARMQRMHRVLLMLSTIAVVGAVGGSHGMF